MRHPHELATKPKQTNFKPFNLLLLLAVAAVGVVLMVMEGIKLPHWPFIVFSLAVSVLAIWYAAFEISTKRLLCLMAVAGLSGFATQVVGSTVQGVWVYPGPHGSYFFVPSMFACVSTAAYGLISLKVGPWLRTKITFLPRRFNVALVLGLGALLVTFSAQYGSLHEPLFWLYYGALIVFAVYAALLMDLATLLSIVLVGVVLGGLSELLGASSGVWSFSKTPWLPPAYLVLGSWPLEVLLHYGLSGILAKEKLFAKPRFFTEDPTYALKKGHHMFTGKASMDVYLTKDEDKFAALDDVLLRAKFFELLEAKCEASGKSKADFRIIIKPNLMFMYSEIDRSTFTDPALVEHLVDRIAERGFKSIKVVEAQSAYGNYFEGREVPNVARVAGYDPRGRYEIVDLTAEAVPHTFEGMLGEHVVGPTWRDADFRISFAKNKTHTWAWYTLTIKNIYGALAKQDKLHEYHYAREIYYPTIDMLVAFPVDFGLVDASLSADGPFGIFADKHPNKTDTIYGGQSLLAVDWVGAQKMGLDPMVSRYMQLAVQAFGKPEPITHGDTSPYPNWENVPKPMIDFWDAAEESYSFTNTVFSIMNHDFVSKEFKRKPVYGLRMKLIKLLGPLGGIAFKRPEKKGD